VKIIKIKFLNLSQPFASAPLARKVKGYKTLYMQIIEIIESNLIIVLNYFNIKPRIYWDFFLCCGTQNASL